MEGISRVGFCIVVGLRERDRRIDALDAHGSVT